MKWYLEVLRKYAVFDGRSGRKEYWYFGLFSSIIYLVLYVIDIAIGTMSDELKLGLLSSIYLLAVITPGLGVTIRRFHDLDYSGWWFMACLIPYVGPIALVIFLAQKGTPGTNRYGAVPSTL